VKCIKLQGKTIYTMYYDLNVLWQWVCQHNCSST